MSLAPPQHSTNWDAQARAYDAHFVPFSHQVARAALDVLRPPKGTRLLDVAAGTGALTLQALQAGVDVTAIDFSAGMLEQLSAKLARRGFGNVPVHVMDGQALGFEDDTFDAAGSSLGLIFFPDPQQGLRELARVVRPGGRAFVTQVLLDPPPVLFQLTNQAALDAKGLQGEAPLDLPLRNPKVMRESLTAAGFARAKAHVAVVSWKIDDLRQYWRDWVRVAPPALALMSSLTEAEDQAAEDLFVARAQEHVGTSGTAAFDIDILVGTGLVR